MRRYIWFLAIVLALGGSTACAGSVAGPIEAGDLVILNGRVFDGTGAPPIDDGMVAVRGERIIAVGPRVDFAVPDGVQVIDAGGGFIMPGVIDSHVHVLDTAFLGIDVLTPWLQDGVTTIRDLYTCATCVPLLRSSIASVAPDPPRVVIAGPGFGPPGGLREGAVVATVDEARAAVANLLDSEGADLIKIYDPEMPLEISQAIVEEAHARGKRVASHPDGLVNAVAAGVDDVSHPPLPEVSDEVFQQAADQGIEMNTTLIGGPDPVLARYRDLGGVIALGTDSPFAPGCAMPVYEMRNMVASGLTPNEVLVASTKNAAVVSNLAMELGTLEVSKIADIIVVDGDPLADISAMENVSLVMKGGRLVDLTTRPTSNEFAFAEPINDLPFEGTASFYCANQEEEEPAAPCVSAESPRTGTVWYRFVPETDGLILLDLTRPLPLELPSVTDAAAVYTGTALDSLTEVACDYREVTFSADADTTYYLQVYGYTSTADIFASSSGLVHLESMSPKVEESP